MPDPDDNGEAGTGAAGRASWTFLTNHTHVLVCIANDPGVRLRDVADQVGITERAAQSIVADLVTAGYLTRSRVGRRNHNEIHADRTLRHPVEGHRSLAGLLTFLAHAGDSMSAARARPR